MNTGLLFGLGLCAGVVVLPLVSIGLFYAIVYIGGAQDDQGAGVVTEGKA